MQEQRTVDLKDAAKHAAATLSGPQASWGELDRARELLLLVGDEENAKGTSRRMGEMARGQAGERERADDAGGALNAWFDAATAFGQAGAGRDAQACAQRFLALWPAFEASKRIEMQPARSATRSSDGSKRLRRLPKGGVPALAPTAPEPLDRPAEAGPSVLPVMFLEMHASALHLAGQPKEAGRRFEEAMVAVEAEVARRRQSQQWGEALAAARGLARIALEAGGRARLDAVRPDLIAVAREAAAEALTPDYFARGREQIPEQAIELALLEAHALGNESLAHKYEDEAAAVLERSAEVTQALGDARTAAEAVLAWEDAWPMLATRPELRRALLSDHDASAALTGPFAALAGMAPSHPLRREVEDFRERVDEAVARARLAAPRALERAARALLARDPVRTRDLAERARKLCTQSGRPVSDPLLALLRDAHLAAGERAAADLVQQDLKARAGQPTSEEGQRRREALDAQWAAGGGLAARGHPAVVALAAFLVAQGAGAWQRGEAAEAGLRFEEAAALGHPQALPWLRLLALAGAPAGHQRTS
jgi:hypothetical protein